MVYSESQRLNGMNWRPADRAPTHASLLTLEVVPDSNSDLLFVDVIELVMITVSVEIEQPGSENVAVVVSPLPAGFQSKRAAEVDFVSQTRTRSKERRAPRTCIHGAVFQPENELPRL